jgi:hypothetical protein
VVAIKPKSPELIQAQVAAFNNETVSNVFNRVHILKHLPQIADDNPTTVTRPPNVYDNLYRDADNDDLGDIEAANVADYRKYLADNLGTKKPEFEHRAKIMQSYQPFAPAVARLKARLNQTKYNNKDKDFLSSGFFSDAFTIHREGTPYVVRIPSEDDPIDHLDNHIAAAAKARGMPHVENIIAASYEDGVTVAELMPGKAFYELEPKVFESISDDQLREFIRTIQQIDNTGLIADFSGVGNILYDPKAGFGVIDLLSSDSAGPTFFQEHPGFEVNQSEGFAHLLQNASYATEDMNFETTAIKLLQRYSAILAEESPNGPTLKKSLKEIQRIITQFKLTLVNATESSIN